MEVSGKRGLAPFGGVGRFIFGFHWAGLSEARDLPGEETSLSQCFSAEKAWAAQNRVDEIKTRFQIQEMLRFI